jgi:hypothetical protein
MELERDFYALVTGLSGIALIWLFYVPWQTYCVERARLDLFKMRDRLFSLAEDGRWSFESEDYRLIRASLEKFIQHADEISIWRIFAYTYIAGHEYSSRPADDIKNAFDRGNQLGLGQELNDIRTRVSNILVNLVIKRCSVLLALYLVFNFIHSINWVRKCVQPIVIWIARAIADANIDRANVEERVRI